LDSCAMAGPTRGERVSATAKAVFRRYDIGGSYRVKFQQWDRFERAKGVVRMFTWQVGILSISKA
jgi:hypothetical protein